ncbi:ABC transporter permease [Rhizobiales bacterium TNE-4]|nr:ABC transporter permease [Rhizobiales bacterium TNE-4]MBV1828026.1 ABC transporter permease [Rhizobiales bacterium TNE-4]
MFAYALRSLVLGLLVLVAVAFIAFSMFRFVGDPVANMVGQEATLQDRQELSERLGLNDPWPVQFVRFMGNAARGEFGVSYRQGRKVSDLIQERLPATVELAVLSAIFSTVFGVMLGIYAAIHRTGFVSNTIMTLSLVGVSLPTFLIGIGLIYVFAVELRMLPSFGRGDVVKIGWWSTGLLTESGLKSLVMPVLTLGFFQLTLIMRLVRSEMLEAMRTDYVRFARARGISERSIQMRHALRNTLVPVVTIAGLQLGSVIAFAIVTETVFQWPGLGSLFVNAVQFADVPVMAAYLMFVASVFVIVSLVVDLLYFVIDPRLRSQSRLGKAH